MIEYINSVDCMPTLFIISHVLSEFSYARRE